MLKKSNTRSVQQRNSAKRQKVPQAAQRRSILRVTHCNHIWCTDITYIPMRQGRHELKSTMMTSNRPLEDWGKLIGDIPSATAILDRFLHRSELFQITGRSYRLGMSENNSKGAESPTGSDADKKVEGKAPKGAK